MARTKGTSVEPQKSAGAMQGLLNWVERAGNKVPHPSIIFLVLIGIIMILSAIFAALGTSVTFEQANPLLGQVEDVTVHVRSLLDAEGLQFVFTSPVQNFSNFAVVGVVIVAMIGVGMAEESGLIGAMIRKLVLITHPSLITVTVVFLGLLSSIATDAGYLVLIPLGAAIYHSVGRHPLAGLAAAFAGVSAGFAVNVLVTPLDGMLVEVTNEAIALIDPSVSIGVMSNFWFELASVVLLTVVFTFVSDRIVEPRLGEYDGPKPEGDSTLSSAEKRGLKFAGFGTLAVAVGIAALSAWPGAPLWGYLLDSLIMIIMIVFLVAGICYGIGTGTVKNSMDVINPIVKTISGLAGLIFLLLVIAQFIAYFNYSNLATVAAVELGDWLEESGLGAIPLLLGFVVVILLLDIVMVGSLPKWAIFAPIFVPLFLRLGVEPDAVLAAYRLGDSPMNVITPLMPYFAVIVAFGERYRKNIGVGTIVSMMLPYTAIAIVAWVIMFTIWLLAGIPFGF